MFKSFREKVALSGISLLIIGVTLLIFTFISAYGLMNQNLQIIASEDLVRTFGEALAPLIATSMRIMYLGIMGWTASLITLRGVTIVTNAPKAETTMPQEPMIHQEKKAAKKTETEPQETEIAVLPPKEIPQQKKQ